MDAKGGVWAKRVLFHFVGGRGSGAAAMTLRVLTGEAGGVRSKFAGGGVFGGVRLRGVWGGRPSLPPGSRFGRQRPPPMRWSKSKGDGLRGRRRNKLHGTALAWWRRRILLRGGDIGAAVGTPGAPSAVRHAGVADLAAVHQRAAEQASAEAVLRLQTAHTAARLDVGAHLHKFAAGGAPELAASGAAIVADTWRSNGRLHLRRVDCNWHRIHDAFLFRAAPESDGWPDHGGTRGGGCRRAKKFEPNF